MYEDLESKECSIVFKHKFITNDRAPIVFFKDNEELTHNDSQSLRKQASSIIADAKYIDFSMDIFRITKDG